MRADRLRRLRRIQEAATLIFIIATLAATGFVENAPSVAWAIWALSLPVGALAFYTTIREERIRQ